MRNKMLLILLALSLLITAGCAAAPDKPAQAESTPALSVTPESPSEPETIPEVPEAEEAVPGSEKTGDIVILYTSDVHCAVGQGFGYAGVQQIRDALEANGDEVLLVDNGDAIQGEPIGMLSEGSEIIKLMNVVGYDAAIPGNHEFDYGMDRFMELTEQADFPYLSCNFRHAGEPVFEPYIILEAAGHKIAFVGITTPQTLNSSSPVNFQNEAGEFIYSFMEDETGETLCNEVQSVVNQAREDGADYVCVMGHVGNIEQLAPWTYANIVANTTGIDLFLDGHSHDNDQVSMKNANGETVLRSACGTKLQSIGWARIAADGTLSTGLYSWDNEVPLPELLNLQNEARIAVHEATVVLQDMLNEVIGTSQAELLTHDPVATDSNGRSIRLIRHTETNLGDFCADAFRAISGSDIAIINGGGIRTALPTGTITVDDIIKIHPFGNEVCVIEVTGQQILDALEWGSRFAPNEDGAFFQISGLTYELHTYLPTTCEYDASGMFTQVTGEYRVKNVMIGDQPLDLNATYTLAGTDYILLELGGGCSMFDNATILQEYVDVDSNVLISYVQDVLNGIIGEEYANPYGQGRIIFVEEKP